MKRFLTFDSYSTGRPAPTCLQTLGSYVPYSASFTHSFNKRRGETVHIAEGSHFAVAHHFHFFEVLSKFLKDLAQLNLTRTLHFSSNIRNQISLADATR